MVQQYRLTLVAVVECNVEGTAKGDDELLQTLVRMTTTALSTRHVINPVGTLDVKGYHRLSLSNCQVASRIGNPWKLNQLNV